MVDVMQRIVSSNLCHGCGGCVAALPTGRAEMVMTEAGYLRPKALQQLTPEDNRTVVNVCSGYTIEHDTVAANSHTIWGPITALHIGYAIAEDVRYKGSSGGVISALLLHLLRSGDVEYVLHAAADPRDPFGNVVRLSRSREDVLAAAGSRYIPSAPLASLERHLSSGAHFAVVGKPCDIASLRRMARHDPRIDQQIPMMLAFLCAGVPSRKGALATAQAMGADPSEVERFAFRGEGWPGFARARLRDGRELRMSYNESWGRILNRYLQFRCKICPDATGEFADVVCADAWYSQDGYPEFNERPGRSLVICRSKRGEALLRAAAANKDVNLKEVGVDSIIRMQPYQAERKRAVLARIIGLALAGRIIPRYRNLRLMRAARQNRLGTLLRNTAGTFLRALRVSRDVG
jgi:coenzyme F420 hydrogenase subunit beta